MAFSTLNLSELSSDRGFVIANTNGLYSGSVASNGGDINGDGIDDFILGDRFGNRNGDRGLSYVVFGNSSIGTSGFLELSELDGNNGFVIASTMVFDFFGNSVSNGGDINGDGIDDIIIGAPRGGEYIEEGGMDIDGKGKSYVVFGSFDIGDSGSLDLLELNGRNGFAITGVDDRDQSGFSLSDAGDVNGDGIDDLIIGAPFADSTSDYSSEGESYVVFGSDNGFEANLQLSELDGDNGFVIRGLDEGDRSGYSVSNGGDINGDGIGDLIIGAPGGRESIDGYSFDNNNSGKSYVIFGGSDIGDSGNLDLSQLDGNNGFVITAIEDGDRFGIIAVSNAGDINNDDLDDIIIGTSSDKGKSYVVFGSRTGFAANLELSQLNGSNGFKITGVNSSDGFGLSVSNAGDFNGDNINDIIIGAPFADSDNSDSNEGASYVIFGSDRGFVADIDLANPDDIEGLLIEGINAGDQAGSSVSGAGDINGDGVDDLIVVAPYANYEDFFFARESYIIFGEATTSEPNELIGTKKDDRLTGSNKDDRLSGLKGDDTLSGDGGQDEILGGRGNDILSGGENDDNLRGQRGEDKLFGDGGDDNLFGGASNDFILGGEGNDSIQGNQNSDRIFGGNGNDTIQGNPGNDLLFGEAGNDSILGGLGNDLIQGSSGVGVDELDTLTGGVGSDIFVLGNANGVFYDDGDDSTTGESNLALIEDLNQNRDTIQLSGSADLYSLDISTSETGKTNATIIYNSEGLTVGEVIAILEDVDSNLSINDSAFTFV